MLLLFDIDGTLLLTRQAGRDAMLETVCEMLGRDCTFDGIEIAGRLDPLIWQDLAARNGLVDPMVHHDRFRSAYAARLERKLTENPTARALPGIPELISAVGAREGVTLGLLTGNYPETGRLKVAHAGLDPDRFTVNAWGSDGGHRRELPVVAMAHYAERHGRPISPERVVIIGDTPHDVDCAQHNGCRSLGVATGRFDSDTLRRCEADLVVENLSDTEAVLGWIFSPA